MKNLIRSMTMNERSQFKNFVTKAERLRMFVKTMTTKEQAEFEAYAQNKNER